jgi:hypothetical protein
MDRKVYDGWTNGLLGQAYDLVYEAEKEHSPKTDSYQVLRKLLSAIENADERLEELHND